jgi:hypothetical protein
LKEEEVELWISYFTTTLNRWGIRCATFVFRALSLTYDLAPVPGDVPSAWGWVPFGNLLAPILIVRSSEVELLHWLRSVSAHICHDVTNRVNHNIRGDVRMVAVLNNNFAAAGRQARQARLHFVNPHLLIGGSLSI